MDAQDSVAARAFWLPSKFAARGAALARSRARGGSFMGRLTIYGLLFAGFVSACSEPSDEENNNLARELRNDEVPASPTFVPIRPDIQNSSSELAPRVVRSYPLNSADELIERSQVKFDPAVSADGRGSMRLEVDLPTTVGLFETGPIDAQDVRLEYRARVRLEESQGPAILEMRVVVNGREDLLSRKVVEPAANPEEWIEVVAPFELKKGEYPDNVKLAVVLGGRARLWIDDLELVAVPHTV